MKLKGKQIFWKARYIDENGKESEMKWVSYIDEIKKYYKAHPEFKNVKIDSLKNL